jgi:leucyl-tRNA synthetase
MGYDSFGLPAEQYAIQTGQHPEKTTKANIARYREQLDKIGFSFDWSREVRTSNPDYYRWTQWIFIQLFESWYNLATDKAESIETLVKEFQQNGNTKIHAVCDENVETFTAEEWHSFSEEKQQKILLQYRLTYLAETEVNWCPALGTVLANDEIINGVSERGGHPVVRKKMTQWSMRITAYSERLLQGLDTIDWSESIKESQRNWIGKSVGASVKFKVSGFKFKVEVFTTRPDTIFGVTFLTLAPEHELVTQITSPEQKEAVEAYIEATSKRSERERMADVKTISGVFTGAYAEHPLTKEPIPIWIGDYVLAGYGTGAVMAVPCGDERDYAFANFFKGTKGMPEIKNIFNQDISEAAFTSKDGFELINSDFLNGLGYKEATKKVIEALEDAEAGKAKINYRLRDAVFSRQRYWGEPIPMYYKNGVPYPIPTECLPLELPEVEKYLPTEDGQPPLGNATVWAWDTDKNKVVSNDWIDQVKVFPLELNTMPGWAGSSWYWMRYMDATNEQEFVGKEALNFWESVDLYIGGSEHATGHLLYARFWNKFLKDKGLAPTEEPFKKLINQGMILGMSAFVYRTEDSKKMISKGQISNYKTQPIHVDLSCINDITNELDIEKFRNHPLYVDYKNAEFIYENLEDDSSRAVNKFIVGREVEKMSKSKYNVVNPDDICNEYGADTLRLYEMFLGPLEQAKPWNTAGITGVYGFLKKLWRLYFDDNGLNITNDEPTAEMYKSLHKTIKKVTEDIENFSFNTSVSQFMICVNELSQQKCRHRAILEPLAILISPYAPHIAEELWEKLGHSTSVAFAPFPKFEEKYLVESTKEYPVSFNGKMRFTLNLPLDLTAAQIETIVMQDERTQNYLQGNTPKKTIIVPGKIINIVM